MTVPASDVIKMYHPDPADPYRRASGTGGVLGDELETDEYSSKYIKRWFKNMGVPPLIVSLKDAKQDNVDRLEEKWMRKLSNRPNIPYFTNRELQVEQLNQTFNDQQLTTLRKDQRDIIIHVFGAPPEIFGIIENSNRSTIDAADYLMAKYVIVPRLEFMRIVLQQQLIERYDSRLILDYISPVMEDDEFKLKVIQAAPWSMDVDEIRALAGLGPDKTGAGDGRVIPVTNTWVPSLKDLYSPDAVAPPAPAVPTPDDGGNGW
jgi:hypothetical protein